MPEAAWPVKLPPVSVTEESASSLTTPKLFFSKVQSTASIEAAAVALMPASVFSRKAHFVVFTFEAPETVMPSFMPRVKVQLSKETSLFSTLTAE